MKINRRKKQKKTKSASFLKKIFLKLIFLLTIILLPFSVFKFVATKLLNAENIVCTIENQTNCSPDILKHLEPLKSKMLLTLNCEKFINEIIKNQLNFSQFSYKKQWPKTLIIDFKLKQVSYLATNQSGQTFAFDNNGKILDYYHSFDQDFIIIIDENKINNNQLDKTIHQAIINFIKLNKIYNWSIKELNFEKSSEFLFLVKSKNFCTVFDLLNYQNKFNQYHNLIQSDDESKTKNKEIDLRFNLAIIREKTEICN